jgi:hypothetical protein
MEIKIPWKKIIWMKKFKLINNHFMKIQINFKIKNN